MGSFPEMYKDPKLPPIVNLNKLSGHEAAWPYKIHYSRLTARSTFSSPNAGTERCLFVLFCFFSFKFHFLFCINVIYITLSNNY